MLVETNERNILVATYLCDDIYNITTILEIYTETGKVEVVRVEYMEKIK